MSCTGFKYQHIFFQFVFFKQKLSNFDFHFFINIENVQKIKKRSVGQISRNRLAIHNTAWYFSFFFATGCKEADELFNRINSCHEPLCRAFLMAVDCFCCNDCTEKSIVTFKRIKYRYTCICWIIHYSVYKVDLLHFYAEETT